MCSRSTWTRKACWSRGTEAIRSHAGREPSPSFSLRKRNAISAPFSLGPNLRRACPSDHRVCVPCLHDHPEQQEEGEIHPLILPEGGAGFFRIWISFRILSVDGAFFILEPLGFMVSCLLLLVTFAYLLRSPAGMGGWC